uniref:Uncharacterized protein n=1 Tax=Aureoumbra lagunensis TaxID=44058 RepID=A0A7S3NFN3_9STRA
MSCRLGRPVGAGNKNGNKVEQFFGMKPGSCPATICGKDNKEYKKLTKKMAAQKKEMENHKKRQEKRILHGDLLAANVQADDDFHGVLLVDDVQADTDEWFSKYLENPATESTEPPKPSRHLAQQTLSWVNINNSNKRPHSQIDSSTAVKKKKCHTQERISLNSKKMSMWSRLQSHQVWYATALLFLWICQSQPRW